jgi:transposase
MVQTAQRIDEGYEPVLLRALAREGRPERLAPSPGHQIRTCPVCGDRAVFRLEPEGTWYRCSDCGHYA